MTHRFDDPILAITPTTPHTPTTLADPGADPGADLGANRRGAPLAYRIGAPCPDCAKPMTFERGYPETRMEPGLDDSVGCDDCGMSYAVLPGADDPGDVDGIEPPALEPWP